MSLKFSRNIIAAFSKVLLIFLSVFALLSLGILLGMESSDPEILSAAFGDSDFGVQQIGRLFNSAKLLEVTLFVGLIATLMFCWTIYLLRKSRYNSEIVSVTNSLLTEEIEKGRHTKDVLDEVNEILIHSGSQLNSIIEGSSDLVSAIDRDYKLTCFNKAYFKDTKNLFGIDIEIGTNILDAQKAFPEKQEKSRKFWDRALSGEQFAATEHFIGEDGQIYYYEVTYNPLRNGAGEIIGASHIVRNVTERRLSNDALKRERDFVSTVVEASNLLVMVTDLEGRITRFNNACEVASGYEFEEIKGRIFWNLLVPAEEAPEIKLSYRNIKSVAVERNWVTHWITKDEHSRLISWRNSVVQNEDGDECIIATGIDITEKEEFKETQNRILDILETSSDFIGISDIAGAINYLNPAGHELLNINKRDELSSYKLINAYPKWAAELIQKEGIPTAIKRGSWIGETAIITANGREIPVSQLILAHKNDRDEVVYISTVARDISKQKRLEKQLSTARDAALATAKLKSDFLANMSHEIRTPMNGIIGLAELLLSTNLDREQHDYVKSVQNSGELLLTIVNDILDFSKIEAGKFHLETVSFDLRETLESILDIFAEPAHRKGLEIALLVQDDVPNGLFGDPRRLRQILTNLIANAIKFTETGEIVIRVKSGEESQKQGLADLRFEVVDTGIGILEDVQGGLFDAFTQADSSITRKYGGTGLGLAISKQLVEMMNGKIGVDSEPGQGATFWFNAVFEAEEASSYSQLYSGKVRGKRVLIVDDNDAVRGVMLQQAKWLGMVAEEAPSGEAALDMLEAAAKNGESFEIVVVDLNMPGFDGIDLVRKIREHSLLRKTGIVLLPSINDHELVKKAKKIEVESYLFKPVRQTELYNQLSDMCDPAKQSLKRRDHARSEDLDSKLLPADEWVKVGPETNLGIRILIAEDNSVNQKVISNQVAKLGYAADLKANGEEVVKALENGDYALILMDCQMPVLDGLQATAKIRENEPDGKRIPIIAITANAIEGDRERCLEAGMDDYITKPTKQDDLAKVIARWLPEISLETENEEDQMTLKLDSPELQVINERLAELAETCGEDITLECIELFIQDIKESVQRLRAAMEDSNFESIDNEAHKLKGSSANMGASVLPKLCQELMLAVRENRETELQKLFQSIVEEYEELIPIYLYQKETYTDIVSKLQLTG